MRIGFFLSGDERFPSARIGGINVVKELGERGLEIEVVHYPSNPSIQMPDMSHIVSDFDILVFQKKGGVGFQKTVQACKKKGVKTVYSCCDYVPTLIKYAELCDIGVSPSKFMCRLAGKNWVWIPDMYEDFCSECKYIDEKASPLWFGTEDSYRALEKLVPFKPITISDHPEADLAWSLEAMNDLAEYGNVVVVPQELTVFGMSKGAGRVVQARVMGFPVIASSVPAYKEIPGVAFANSENEWLEALEYMDSVSVRRELGNLGRNGLEIQFSPEQVGNRWLAVFFSLLGSRRAIKGT